MTLKLPEGRQRTAKEAEFLTPIGHIGSCSNKTSSSTTMVSDSLEINRLMTTSDDYGDKVELSISIKGHRNRRRVGLVPDRLLGPCPLIKGALILY